MSVELRTLAAQALAASDPGAKVAAVEAIGERADAGDLAVDCHARPAVALEAGRPGEPVLVDPRALPRRRLSSAAGRVALYHALAHIEFNAINLALDAVARFAGLPRGYYLDWLRVAREEARHFTMLAALLEQRGSRYGAMPAHEGLWDVARKTAGDALARMALVPRLLEARGLDVTPGIQARLRGAGDAQGVAVLDVILREEIGHVAIGNRWYRHLCAERGEDPIAAFERVRARHGAPAPRPPFNLEARAAAGFEPAEIEALEASDRAGRTG